MLQLGHSKEKGSITSRSLPQAPVADGDSPWPSCPAGHKPGIRPALVGPELQDSGPASLGQVWAKLPTGLRGCGSCGFSLLGLGTTNTRKSPGPPDAHVTVTTRELRVSRGWGSSRAPGWDRERSRAVLTERLWICPFPQLPRPSLSRARLPKTDGAPLLGPL